MKHFDTEHAHGEAEGAGHSFAIYEITSKHKGGGRAFLQSLKPKYRHVRAVGICPEGDYTGGAAMFWFQMFREGLVHSFEDDEGNEIEAPDERV